MQNGSFYHRPQQGSRRNPAKRFRWEEDERSRVSESCRLRRDEGFVVRSDDGQHRICLVCGEAAALPNALGGAWPHTPKLRAEAQLDAQLLGLVPL